MVGFEAEKVGRCPLGEDTKFCIKDLLCGMCGFGRSFLYLVLKLPLNLLSICSYGNY